MERRGSEWKSLLLVEPVGKSLGEPDVLNLVNHTRIFNT